MASYTKLLIERKSGLDWEPIAYPVDDVPKATILLDRLRADESIRVRPAKLRLIRITTEIINQEPTP